MQNSAIYNIYRKVAKYFAIRETLLNMDVTDKIYVFYE